MQRSDLFFHFLDSYGYRGLASFLATVYATIRRAELTKIYFENGMWIHSDSEGFIAGTKLQWEKGLKELSQSTEDLFLYQSEVKSGNIVVDIGAGLGAETIYLSKKVGCSGKVIAIEAHPETFRCLQKTIALNQLRNVITLQAAVSNKHGKLYIQTSDNYLANSVCETQQGHEVKAIPLDDIVKDLGLKKIDYIKMNIEGAEIEALDGMTRILLDCERIVVSCHDFLADRGGSSIMRTKAKVCEILRDNHYELYIREEDPREWVRDFVYARRKIQSLQ